MSVFAGLGILLGIVCLTFNIYNSKVRWVHLVSVKSSSPHDSAQQLAGGLRLSGQWPAIVLVACLFVCLLPYLTGALYIKNTTANIPDLAKWPFVMCSTWVSLKRRAHVKIKQIAMQYKTIQYKQRKCYLLDITWWQVHPELPAVSEQHHSCWLHDGSGRHLSARDRWSPCPQGAVPRRMPGNRARAAIAWVRRGDVTLCPIWSGPLLWLPSHDAL